MHSISILSELMFIGSIQQQNLLNDRYLNFIAMTRMRGERVNGRLILRSMDSYVVFAQI